MNFLYEHLEFLLRVAAIIQFAVAALNLALVRIMHWERDVERMPLLIREVFHIHAQFISITLVIFSVLTWRFAGEFATAEMPLAVWLAISIGIFWGVRSAMQWLHYSSVHWRGNPARTAVHWALFLGYGTLAAVYLIAGGRSFV